MHLYPPDSLDPDDIEGGRRHPVTRWLLERASEEEGRLYWHSVTPETAHILYRYQGMRSILSGIKAFIRGDKL